MTDNILWLRELAEKGGKGTVDNIDARALGRVADELEYLSHFFNEADFGPAHEDVVEMINEEYDKPLPEGYGPEEEDWDSMVRDAHLAIDRIQDNGMRRLAGQFGPLDPDPNIEPALSARDMEIDDRPHKCLEGLEEDERAVYRRHNPPGDSNKI